MACPVSGPGLGSGSPEVRSGASRVSTGIVPASNGTQRRVHAGSGGDPSSRILAARPTDDAQHADIAVDGAHVRIKAHEQNGRRVDERVVFDIKAFLVAADCQPKSLTDEWRGM